VLKSVVRSARINEVVCSKLFDVSQPLELRGVDHFYKQRMNFNMSMNGIIEYLNKMQYSSTNYLQDQ